MLTKDRLLDLVKDIPGDMEICLHDDSTGGIVPVHRARLVNVSPIVSNTGKVYTETNQFTKGPKDKKVLVIQ